MFNIQFRKVGGLRFLFVGRLTFMFCVSRATKPGLAKKYGRDGGKLDGDYAYAYTIDHH